MARQREDPVGDSGAIELGFATVKRNFFESVMIMTSRTSYLVPRFSKLFGQPFSPVSRCAGASSGHLLVPSLQMRKSEIGLYSILRYRLRRELLLQLRARIPAGNLPRWPLNFRNFLFPGKRSHGYGRTSQSCRPGEMVQLCRGRSVGWGPEVVSSLPPMGLRPQARIFKGVSIYGMADDEVHLGDRRDR